MRPDGLHVLSCREKGNGGALGLISAAGHTVPLSADTGGRLDAGIQ